VTCGGKLPHSDERILESKPKVSQPETKGELPLEKSLETQDVRRWWEKKRFFIPIISVLILAMATNFVEETPSPPIEYGAQQAERQGSSASEEQMDDVDPVPADTPDDNSGIPSEQQQFISIVDKHVVLYSDAKTELQAANSLNERDEALCQLTNQGQITDWIGFVKRVGANREGKGTLEIEIASAVDLKTWNNAFSDIGDGTLISPSSALFNKILPLEGGEKVRFSGRFIRGSNHCLKDSHLSERNRANKPAFIVKFSQLEVIG